MEEREPVPRPKRGRPSKSADTRRTQRVVTFVTDAERARLEQLALESDRSVSFVVHRMIALQLEHASLGDERPRERKDES